MIDGTPFDINKVNWPDVILCLTSYADGLIKDYTWFRKKRPDSFLKGKQVEDYVFEAIEKFLQHPEKFNPTKRTLVGYLKMHILRHLVDNDAKAPENKLNKDIYSKIFATDDEQENYLESILPSTTDSVIEKLDADTLLKDVETQIKGNEDAEKIFLGVVCGGMKRREVCAEFQMTEKDFDNAIRRVRTALGKTINKFELKNA